MLTPANTVAITITMGINIDECIALKDRIEELICVGQKSTLSQKEFEERGTR